VLIVGFAGGLLSLAAGYMNAICFVTFGQTVTHMTGLLTKVSVALVRNDLGAFAIEVVQLVCFTLGAFTSSLLIGGNKKFSGGRHYSVVLCLIGVLVLLSAFLFPMNSVMVILLLSFAAGMQNGMTTFFSVKKESNMESWMLGSGCFLTSIGVFLWVMQSISCIDFGGALAYLCL
jgi:uncharacterized membrane protein YoaK (UPF0700 family)